MFLIGEFAKIAQVSSNQLRKYDRMGLFSPHTIDPMTGYRYYSANQLPQLNRILALKEMGLTLAQVKQFLEEEISPDDLRAMLALKKAQIEQMLHTELTRVRYIESRIEQIDQQGYLDNYDIVLKSVPKSPYLSVREICPTLEDGRLLIGEMMRRLPQALDKQAIGHLTTVIHSDEFTLENIDLSIGFQLTNDVSPEMTIPLSDDAEMRVGELPAEEFMLTATWIGHPRLKHGGYNAIGMWAEANGYQFTRDIREVFINFRPDRLTETVMEIQFPVEPLTRELPHLT
ncbi:MAG: MerR family transcriptional regulator [Chloroflexota bacterium]